jgi:RimJ/RimL family protein N-acetyltransferase
MAKFMDMRDRFVGVTEHQPRGQELPDRKRAGATVARGSRLARAADELRPAWRSMLGHLPRSAPAGKWVVLRDGSQVLIRQVLSADAPLLADGFARLSAASRWMRFLTPKKQLSPAELRYFTDIDHYDHEALGALDQRDGSGVGIARYIRHAGDPHAAEIAITIVDDWQGRGLGAELLIRLSDRARQRGIHRFTALVAADNVAMAGLLRSMCASLVRRESDTLEYEIPLAPCKEGDHERGALLSR